MSQMDVSKIKQGDRVAYAIGDVEYDAVALGEVTTGYNNAIRASGFFLTLRYLDEQGNPVTISGAPLLGIDAGRVVGWHARRADDALRPEPQSAQPAPVHELLPAARVAPDATMGIGPEVIGPEDPLMKSSGIDGDAGDWTQAGMDKDGFPVQKGSAGDVSGGQSPIPTQAEADAVAAAAAAEDAAKGNPEPLPSEKFKVDDKVRFTAESGNDTTPVYTISGGESGEGDSAFWFWRLDEMDGLFLGQNLVLAEEVNQAA